MLYGTDVAVCSDINTKHINTVRAEYQLINFKLVGKQKQVGFKKLM